MQRLQPGSKYNSSWMNINIGLLTLSLFLSKFKKWIQFLFFLKSEHTDIDSLGPSFNDKRVSFKHISFLPRMESPFKANLRFLSSTIWEILRNSFITRVFWECVRHIYIIFKFFSSANGSNPDNAIIVLPVPFGATNNAILLECALNSICLIILSWSFRNCS